MAAILRGQFRALSNDRSLRRFVIQATPTGKHLGTGSYGSVEEVDVNGLLCAAKKIHELLLDAGNVGVREIAAKYVQECEIMSNLRHPNATQFIGLCFLDDCQLPLLVMEKLDGCLDELIETVLDIPLIVKRSVLEDVVKGLIYLHNHNPQIIHRDLTAKNVLLTSSLTAKITDFGNCRLVNIQPGQLARTLSQNPGTLVYMPPEALTDESRYGPSLDIFSFGHLALFLGLQSFPGNLLEPTYVDPNNRQQLLARSEVERRARYFEMLENKFPTGQHHPFVLLVKRCLHNDLLERPSAEDLRTALDEMKTSIDGPYGEVARLDAVRHVVMMKALIKRDTEVREKTDESEIKDVEIHRLQQELEHEQYVRVMAEENLQHMHSQIQRKESQIQQSVAQIQQKDVQIQQKDLLIHQRDFHIQQNEATLTHIRAQLRQKTRELQLQTAELDSVKKSFQELRAYQESTEAYLRSQKAKIQVQQGHTDVSRLETKYLRLQAKCRMLMAECHFHEESDAQIVLDLIEEIEKDENHPLKDMVWHFENFESAIDHLFTECPIQGFCAGKKIPFHEMITMPGCTCSLCIECFKGHFEVVIKEKQVKHFNCPMCRKPDLSNKDDTPEMYELIFVSMIKEYLGWNEYDLCQEKLKEFSLAKDPNFLWCANDKCGSGFVYEGDRTHPRGIQCPGCKNNMCWKCTRPWEAQHDGITCEQFTQWMLDNDPELLELGLAAHLNGNGIECPACNAHYEFARGGCLHFKCTKCPNEFCSGCGESMKKGKECGKYNSCAGKGLHAHHPRDCLFFLQDFSVKELQNFLEANKMDFDTDAPREQIEAAKREKREKKKKKREEPKANLAEEVKDEDVELHCCAEEQNEDVDGLKDEVCGKIAEKGHAGLCDVHYKEYLVNIINKNGLDPITIYELGPIKAMLAREEMDVPRKKVFEDDQQYRDRLIQHVQARLNFIGGRKAGEVQQAQATPPAAAPVYIRTSWY